jgi:hypothetical protein
MKESVSGVPFHVGRRDSSLNADCADQNYENFYDLITSENRRQSPVIVLSGHTHAVHEFRIQKASQRGDYRFYVDDYSEKDLQPVPDSTLAERTKWIAEHSPLLMTSGACLKPMPQFREIHIRNNTIAGVQMCQLPRPEPTADFDPGIRRVQIRCKAGMGTGSFMYAPDNGNDITMPYPQAVYNKPQTHFELIQLGDDKIALRAHNGKYIRAKDGGGGKLAADRDHIRSHETFRMVHRSGNLVAFQAKNGRYLRATRDGKALADSQRIDSWAEFRLSDL